MKPTEAFELGWRSADSGFFFDAMEIIAAVSTEVGGFDALRHPLELVFLARDPVQEHTAWLASVCSSAFGTPLSAPAGVDDYRSLLTDYVFEIVNRWSYIADIRRVNQLQAWFYAGFGLGRASTVLRALQLYPRLLDVAPASDAVLSMPARLQRMAAEAAKQMDVASAEDDLRSVTPLFEDVSRRLKARALSLQRADGVHASEASLQEDLDVFADTARRVRLDLLRVAPRSL
jgi:hypothetical protein